MPKNNHYFFVAEVFYFMSESYDFITRNCQVGSWWIPYFLNLWNVYRRLWTNWTQWILNFFYFYSYVAITFDGWTSVVEKNYLAITSHFIWKDKLIYCLLAFIDISNSSTSQAIKKETENHILKEYHNIKLICGCNWQWCKYTPYQREIFDYIICTWKNYCIWTRIFHS